ncbi:hypothetical protein Goshw_004038 [Gossypium schwendimanii]|uniref:Uncharacterized protein n=2 Tax=Gossypium TaxID=3633 RepID=A0A7J9M0P3_GOSSC|nr:hypothetical protein [Gossypium davidsonii]MBA0864541.1 hypothetical protein [Gossypium schwendimanii]
MRLFQIQQNGHKIILGTAAKSILTG